VHGLPKPNDFANPRDVNIDAKPVEVYGWIKSRYGSSSDGYWPTGFSVEGDKQASQAGANAYAATVLIYSCDQVCGRNHWIQIPPHLPPPLPF
jgi:hypothetical protein